jgi:aspartate 1-decarboxylase
VGINGAAAHLVHPGDIVILIGYGQFEDAEARAFEPSVVFVDGQNRIVEVGASAASVPDHPAASGLRSIPAGR